MKIHTDITQERWNALSLVEQMANVGSEVGRTINWRKKDEILSRNALYRGLELLDATIEDPKNKKRLRELLRVRECLTDYFMYDNQYKSSDDLWNNYFLAFGIAARLNR